MCSGGGIGDFFNDLGSMATLGLLPSTAQKEQEKAAKAQSKAQNTALAEQQRLASEAQAAAAAQEAAHAEYTDQRKKRTAQSYLTEGEAAGDMDLITGIKKSYLGAGG